MQNFLVSFKLLSTFTEESSNCTDTEVRVLRNVTTKIFLDTYWTLTMRVCIYFRPEIRQVYENKKLKATISVNTTALINK